jgi:hypothetical protein
MAEGMAQRARGEERREHKAKGALRPSGIVKGPSGIVKGIQRGKHSTPVK